MAKPLLTLQLDLPPSGNKYYRMVNRKMVLCKAGRLYKDHVAGAVVWEDATRRNLVLPLLGRLSVSIWLHGKTKAKYDIDNRIKALLDAMQHAGVYADDEAVDELHVYRRNVIKGGKCIVQIDQVKND